MRKTILLLTILSILSALYANDSILNRYVILREKECYGHNNSENSIDRIHEDRLSLEATLSGKAGLLDEIIALSAIEKSLCMPLISALSQKNRSSLNPDKVLNEKISKLIRENPVNPPEIEISDLYFFDKNGKKIAFDQTPNDYIQYPVIKDELRIRALSTSEVDEIPVILTLKYTTEVIEKAVILQRSQQSGEIFEKTLSISSLFPFWPGLNGNPVKDGIREFTTISGVTSFIMHDSAEAFRNRMTEYGFTERDNSISGGNYEKLYPDANDRDITCGGTSIIMLYFGDNKYHQVSARNTADWLYFIGHGNHRSGAIWTEKYGDSYLHYILPPPQPDLLPWEGEIELAVLASCSVLDINDYNFNYPMEHDSSPGKYWARLKGMTLLGFNAVVISPSYTEISDFMSSEEVLVYPEQYWLATKMNDYCVCAVSKNNDYYYWQENSPFDLPVVQYELRIIPESEWIITQPDPTRYSFSTEYILKQLNNMKRKSVSQSKVLRSLQNILTMLKTQQNMKACEALERLHVFGDDKRFMKALNLSLYRYWDEGDKKNNYHDNLLKAMKEFESISKDSSCYSIPAKFMTALILGKQNDPKQLGYYKKIMRENPEVSDEAKLGEIVYYYNQCMFKKAIELAEKMIEHGSGDYYSALKAFIKNAEEALNTNFTAKRNIFDIIRNKGVEK